jgi:indolepyruvate ferredoxin oxidoreductase
VFDPLPEPQLPDLERPWNTVVTGVGGTGVLTITALVAMAAHIEGKGCATLNQTGLAQKFGAVVSHVRVARQQERHPGGAHSRGRGGPAAGLRSRGDHHLRGHGQGAHGRTHAVVNDAEVPTASFITDPDARFPTAAMKRACWKRWVRSDCSFLDASASPRQLLGDSIASNLFLLGVAWQRGLVPVSARPSSAPSSSTRWPSISTSRRFSSAVATRIGRSRCWRCCPNAPLCQGSTTAALIDDRAARLASTRTRPTRSAFATRDGLRGRGPARRRR